MSYKYPVYQPSLKGNEIKYLSECIETNWLTEKGRFVQDFEQEMVRFTGAKYATSVANGTHCSAFSNGCARYWSG